MPTNRIGCYSSRMINDMTWTSNNNGGTIARGFDGTTYAIIPWGGAYALTITTPGAAFNSTPTTIGFRPELKAAAQQHSDNLDGIEDEWTGRKIAA